jgi:VanZ family protein
MFSTGQRWLIWGLFCVVWTLALVMPIPSGAPGPTDPAERKLLAKSLHVLAYLLFTVLTGWLQAPARYRVLLLFALMAHGTVTELIQLAVPSRTGSLIDVGIDHLGVLLGVLIGWKWWCKP